MTTVFPFLVRQVLLKVVIQDPLFMHRYKVFPALRCLEIPVSHPSLHIKRRFYQILPALPLLNFLFLNPKSTVNLHGSMISKNAAMIADQGCWASMLADRSIEHRNIFFKVLSSGHSGSQDRPRIAFQNANTVNHAFTKLVHVQIPDIHKPIVMAIFCFERHLFLQMPAAPWHLEMIQVSIER